MTALQPLGLVPVSALPHLDPAHRDRLELPEGLTIAEIVARALPGLPEAALSRVRVALVTPKGELIVPVRFWPRVRPHAGVHVVVRVVPGKGVFRSILTVLVSIAAAFVANFFAPILFAGWSATAASIGKGVLTLALTTAGGLLINALLPPEEEEKEKPAYGINGWRNRFAPNQPVPDPMGRLRISPPFAASSWTEVVGDYIYSRALFLVGLGPIQISDLKLGDTPISTYEEVQYEIREGWPDDLPQTLFIQQVVEVPQGVDITLLNERDEYGNPISAVLDYKPVNRFTATDATGIGILLSFPMGLMRIDDEGDEHPWPMDLDIKYRRVGEVDWTDTDGFHLVRKTKDAFFRLVRIDFPTRGRYEIEILRTSNEEADPADYAGVTYLARCTWAALQSYRPEYPLNFSTPIATVGVRAKASAQLNGTVDNFNCIAEPLRPDFDVPTGLWLTRKTKNPASYGLHVLRGPGNPFPAGDGEIDWPAFEEWHGFCVEKELAYNRMHDFDATLGETLAAIGAAGRAAIIHDGAKWTIVIDRPREHVAAHVSRRNMRDFRWQTSYFEPPDALRVSFLDETADYQPAERLVPWPVDLKFETEEDLAADLNHAEGTEAEVHSDELDLNNGIWVKVGTPGFGTWSKKTMRLTEQLEMPGKTDPDEIFIETRRRQHEIMARATRYSGVQMGNIRTATRGDLVMAARDVIRTVSHSARVRAVEGNMVVLDDAFEMEEGQSYAIRFRMYPADDDDYSVLRSIATHAGRTSVVYMNDEGEAPPEGALVHFGPAAQDSIPVILAAVERGSEDTSVLHMVPAAAEIDAKTDAETPYPWTGRIGPIYEDLTVPGPARIVSVLTGFVGTEDPDGLIVGLAPALGSPTLVGEFLLRHRLGSSSTWETPLVCSASEASISVEGYTAGDEVDLQAKAVGIGGVEGDWGNEITIVVGNDDADIPALLPDASVEAGLGCATIRWQTGPDTNTVKVQIFHNTTGIDPTDTDRLGPAISVVPNTPYTQIHGDPSSTNGFADPGFDSDPAWTKTGWTVSASKANKTAGSAVTIHQAFAMTPGDVIRTAVSVTRTAGGVQARLGGTPVTDGPLVTASGRLQARLTAVSGNTVTGFRSDTAFEGTLDDAVRFKEKPGHIAQGTHYFWLDPLNIDGRAGPRSALVCSVD